MKLEEAAAPWGSLLSAGTGSPSKTTMTVLDQVLIHGGSVLASSLLEGPGSVLDSRGTVVGSGLPEGCWPGLGCPRSPGHSSGPGQG